MKVLCLAVVPNSVSTSMLGEAARARGHEWETRNPLQVGVRLCEGRVGLMGGLRADVVLTRMGGGTPARAFDLLYAIQDAGFKVVNRPAALAVTRDKLRQAVTLVAAGVPMPETVCTDAAGLMEASQCVPGPPWVLKTLEGHKGTGVMRVDSMASLRSAIDLLEGLGQRALVQRFVPEAAGSDVRVFVLGGVAKAAMRRQALDGEFRSNLHLGGKAEPAALDERLAVIAETAARALGLDVAGVDVLLGKEGPLVLEVNGSPGLEGISRATGLDLATHVVEVLEQRVAMG